MAGGGGVGGVVGFGHIGFEENLSAGPTTQQQLLPRIQPPLFKGGRQGYPAFRDDFIRAATVLRPVRWTIQDLRHQKV